MGEEDRKLSARRTAFKEELEEIEDVIEDTLEDVFTYDEERHGEETKLAKTLLMFRNIAAGLSAVLFVVSMITHISVIRGVAYFFGAVAYVAEILIMTSCFKQKCSNDEMFMAYVFGPLYILLGVTYLIH